MALSPTLNLASPKTKHEADVMALKLFCLLSFMLVGLITAGDAQPSNEKGRASIDIQAPLYGPQPLYAMVWRPYISREGLDL